MKCTDVQAALADRLDDLLEPVDADAVDTHLAVCAPCREARDRAARVRRALYEPWPVASAPVRLSKPAHRLRGLAAMLRYAAVFAAGVLVAQWVGTSAPEVPSSTVAPPIVEAPSIPPSENETRFPRRIR